jgi:hypothetical protein
VPQAGVEAFEGVVRQAGEQLPGEPALGERDQRRAAVGGVRFAGHEPGLRQPVDQGGDRARCHVQVRGERGLGAWSALRELPYQVRPRLGQALAGEAVGRVAGEQHRQFEYPVESCLPSFQAHIVTLTHDELM